MSMKVLPKKMLYLLLFLKDAGTIEGKTKFQKLIFLAKKEYNLNIGYDFVKYSYGPYSFELTNDLETLESLELIDVAKSEFLNHGSPFVGKQLTYILSKKGDKLIKDDEFLFADNTKKEIIDTVINEWNDKPLKTIIKYVYSKYMT